MLPHLSNCQLIMFNFQCLFLLIFCNLYRFNYNIKLFQLLKNICLYQIYEKNLFIFHFPLIAEDPFQQK